MSNNTDSKSVAASVKIYELLLAIYPGEFRREYGPAMQQLFRDQCRDAWKQSRGMGLVLLWMHVLPDLAKTSFVQHLAKPKRNKSFVRMFAAVFVCLFAFSICQMFWTPKVYASTVRYEVRNYDGGAGTNHFRSDPYFLTTQFKIIKSYSILTNVIATLHLDEKLAAQAGEARWTMDQTYAALSDKISVGQTRMTSLIEISVWNPDPRLAADIANSIVGTYRDSRLETWKGENLGGVAVMQAQLSENETNLARVEANLNELRKVMGISDLEQDSMASREAAESQQLQEYQHEETVALTKYLEESNFLASIATIPRHEMGAALSTAYGNQLDPELSALSTRLRTAKDKVVAAQNNYGVNHPEYRVAESQLVTAQLDYDNEINSIVAGMKTRVAIDLLNVRTLQQLKTDWETKKNELAAKCQPYFVLKRKSEELRRNNEELKATILKEEARLGGAGQPPVVTVRDPARPVFRPIRSKLEIFLRWMLGGTLAALLVGGTGVLFAHLIGRTPYPHLRHLD